MIVSMTKNNKIVAREPMTIWHVWIKMNKLLEILKHDKQDYFWNQRQEKVLERSGSVVECLTRERGAVGSSHTDVTALWSLSKTHLS